MHGCACNSHSCNTVNVSPPFIFHYCFSHYSFKKVFHLRVLNKYIHVTPLPFHESKEINALDCSAMITAYSHFCNFLDLLQKQFHHLMSIKLTSKITIPITIHKKQSKCLLLKLSKWIVKIITASVIKMDFKSVKYYSKVQ